MSKDSTAQRQPSSEPWYKNQVLLVAIVGAGVFALVKFQAEVGPLFEAPAKVVVIEKKVETLETTKADKTLVAQSYEAIEKKLAEMQQESEKHSDQIRQEQRELSKDQKESQEKTVGKLELKIEDISKDMNALQLNQARMSELINNKAAGEPLTVPRSSK